MAFAVRVLCCRKHETFSRQPPRQPVEIWRGKRIGKMTREEAIKALKDCATAYRDHLNDDREVWERWQRRGYPPRQGSPSPQDKRRRASRLPQRQTLLSHQTDRQGRVNPGL